MQAVIPAGEIRRLEEHWPAPVFDISDVMKNSEAAPVGKAWITRSGKAVMISINNVQYVSPLAQVKGMLKGERKYANVSTMRPVESLTATTSDRCSGMTTIFDAMPVKVLEELERIETATREAGAPGICSSGKCAGSPHADTMRSSHHGRPGPSGKGSTILSQNDNGLI